jgi:hypothetical protein
MGQKASVARGPALPEPEIITAVSLSIAFMMSAVVSTGRESTPKEEQYQRTTTLPFRVTRGMVCLMTNPTKKVLQFPTPTEAPLASTILLRIGSDRFAIRWEIEKLPPARPFVARKESVQPAKAKTAK